MRIILTIGLLIIIVSCTNRSMPDTIPLTEMEQTIDTATYQSDTLWPLQTQIDPPIDITELKKLPFLTTTSGVLPISESENLCKPEVDGFFGHYYLINEDNNWVHIGELYVYAEGEPENWQYDTAIETFAKIKLLQSDIKVWDIIGVGTHEKDVIAFIGQNFHYKKGTILHADINEYSADFTILADTINRLTIRRNCKTK